jgi:transcriptional regulator with XRE-family HTH domain
MSKEDEIRRRQFGRRLQKALNARGWTQSELARRIASLLKPTVRIGRDNVSKWVRGKVLPSPPALEAICKILEMETNELLPGRYRRMWRGAMPLTPRPSVGWRVDCVVSCQPNDAHFPSRGVANGSAF